MVRKQNPSCKLESELFQLSIDIEGKVASLASPATTSPLTREQKGSIMDMLGEGKDQLLMYMECAEEIHEGRRVLQQR